MVKALIRIAAVLGLVMLSSVASAQDAKPDKRPRVVVASPLAIKVGEPVKLLLRGMSLDEITEVKVASGDAKVEVASKGKATVPQNYEAKKIGDTQAELKFTLPADSTLDRLQLTVVAAAGVSDPYEIAIGKTEELIEDKEPNDGFKTAQSIAVGKTVVGTIHDSRNVDVFEFKGTAGQKLEIRVHAAQLGSPVDPVLTLYDGKGQVIADADDTDGRDPRLEVVLSSTGSFFVGVQDANDAGGIHFAYLLKVSAK